MKKLYCIYDEEDEPLGILYLSDEEVIDVKKQLRIGWFLEEVV